jgi:hypothetical protein
MFHHQDLLPILHANTGQSFAEIEQAQYLLNFCFAIEAFEYL